MSKFKHRNIVRFIGVCFEKMPRFLVLELLAGGDLKTFLRSCRGTIHRPSPLSMGDLMVMVSCYFVARVTAIDGTCLLFFIACRVAHCSERRSTWHAAASISKKTISFIEISLHVTACSRLAFDRATNRRQTCWSLMAFSTSPITTTDTTLPASFAKSLTSAWLVIFIGPITTAKVAKVRAQFLYPLKLDSLVARV